MIEARELDIPVPFTYVKWDFDPLPCFLVGNKIFLLKTYLMRPYPGKLTKKQRIVNCRLWRDRRASENTFGILCARWRMFYTPIRAKVENVEKYVLVCLTCATIQDWRTMHHIALMDWPICMMPLETYNNENGEVSSVESDVSANKSCQRISLL